MPTRRSFLFSSALSTAALADNVKPASAIAALQSRRSEAQPISPAERQMRVERAQRLMTEHKMGAICLAGGTSMVYFTGVHWWNSERLFLAVIPASGDLFYVCPGFEEERAREQIARGSGGRHAQVFTWQEDESPYALVASSLK